MKPPKKPVKLIGLAGILIFWVACAGPRDYLERGKRAFEKGNYADAALNYQKAIQKDSQFAEAFQGLAATQLKQGKIKEALAIFERALHFKPADDALRGVCRRGTHGLSVGSQPSEGVI